MSDELQDANGLSLPRDLAIKLARANMIASDEPDTADREDEATLIEWASDADGAYFGPQVALLSGGDYAPCRHFRPPTDDIAYCDDCGFTFAGHGA